MSSSGIRSPPPTPRPARARGSDDELRGGEVLDRDPERLEHRQLVLVLPARMHASEHLAELGLDVIRPDRAFGGSDDVVAGLRERGLAPVGEERRRRDGLRVELADGREARADRIDVRTARQPATLHDRLRRRRRRAYDVSPEEGRVCGGFDDRADLGTELLRGLERARPDPDLRVVEHRPHREDVRACLDACAENRDPLRLRPRESAGGDRRHRCGPDRRDRRGVQQRDELTGLAVVQEHAALVGVEAACRVPRRDHDLLERPHGRRPAPVGGHEAEESGCSGRTSHRAEREEELAARE